MGQGSVKGSLKSKWPRLKKIIKWLWKELLPILPTVIVIIVVGALGSVLSIYMAFISKDLIDSAVQAQVGFVKKYAMFFGGVIILQIVVNALLTLATMKAGEKSANTLRARIFKHMTESDYMTVTAYHSGDVLTRMTSDVGAVIGLFVGLVPTIIALLVQLFGAFFALFIYSKPLAILAFTAAPLTLLTSRFFAGALSRLSKQIQEAESKYRSYMGESVQNMLIIKTFEMADQTVSRFKTLQYNRFDLVVKRTKLNIGLSSVLSLGYFTGYFLAFYFGAMGLVAGTITFGTMAAFLQLVERIQSPFMSLAKSIPALISVAVSAERLMTFEAIELDDAHAKKLKWEQAGFTVENLSFTYKPQLVFEVEEENLTGEDKGLTPSGSAKVDGGMVLNRINLEAAPGDIIGIVGQSGEGKTTLVRLLLALTRPEEGSIYFRDSFGNVETASAATRGLISYVPQGNTLFTGTIKENLGFGKVDATDEELMNMMEKVSAKAFVEELEDGLETVIGERGLGISEGQAQRIAIARALLRDKPILILDEVTSALDTETEAQIMASIQSNIAGKTCVIITHRPSTLAYCNRVYKITKGHVTQVDNQYMEND